MEQLGPNLEMLLSRKKENRKFTIVTVTLLAIQMIERLEHLHDRVYLIHRDLKPENFLMGLKNANIVHLVDFGLSRHYVELNTLKHIAATPTNSFFGTKRYCSRNAHNGLVQSRSCLLYTSPSPRD